MRYLFALKKGKTMKNSVCDIDDYAVIELIDTKSFFQFPKIYRTIVNKSKLNSVQKYFLFELFFDFLDQHRSGSTKNHLNIHCDQLSERFGVSIKQLYRWLNALVENNLIEKNISTYHLDGKRRDRITSIKFILPSDLAKDIYLNTPKRRNVKKSEEQGTTDKFDPCPQTKPQDKNDPLIDQQDLFLELTDLLSKPDPFKIKKSSLKYMINFLFSLLEQKKLSGGPNRIKQIIIQVHSDINKNTWPKHMDSDFRINSILKNIKNNKYKIFS